ncbi:hypothetical protein BGW80DRAFT_501401 [Lactifluus volemus]|nr:hypothetical protein BGW80DRAFT_501401 [Lactifluus volemus]
MDCQKTNFEHHRLRTSIPKLVVAPQSCVGLNYELREQGLATLLDERHPATPPHKSYVAFCYARPSVEETARHTKENGVKRERKSGCFLISGWTVIHR